ncbi:MAG: hypothetical protein Q8R82_23125 [Hyphomonadaceae bacterium]|nr:hypothetical protein [Hyphomonadaceae bacterium]
MRAGWAGLAGLVLAGCDEVPPAATLTEVPGVFVGAWVVDQAECRGGGASMVTVTPTSVTFSDSRIAVTGVAPDGDTAARVDGRYTSDYATWDGAVRLELADQGRTLNVVNGSMLTPRVKCP